MSHDPLCPCYRSNRMPTPEQCQCDLIAKVREDAIAAAVQRVVALAEPTQWRPEPRKTARISDVIAAIKGDQE